MESPIKTINKWLTLPKSQSTVVLIGASNSGRSTFAQLINKYVFNINNSELKTEKEKYILEGTISAKSIRIQTTSPRLYSPKNNSQISILDIPCYILTSENAKKWTTFDQKLTTNLLMTREQKLGFLFFIEQKNTKTNATSWKKIFYSWLDTFKTFTDDHINSMAWIITKCPAQITEDSIAKRLKLLQQNLKEEKQADSALVDKIFDSILKNNHYYVFKKPTGNQQTQAEEIRRTYKLLGQLPVYQVNMSHLNNKLQLRLEQQESIRNFLHQGGEDFMYLLKGIKSQLTTQKFSINQEAYEKQIFKKGFLISQDVRQRIIYDKDPFPAFRIIKTFRQTKNLYQKYLNSQCKISDILNSITNLPIMLQDQDNKFVIEFIRQAIILQQKNQFQFKFQQAQKILQDIFIKSRQNFYSTIEKWVQEKDYLQLHQNVIALLEEDTQLPIKFKPLLQKCKEAVLKFRSPKKLLAKMSELIESKNAKNRTQTALRIAMTFQKEKYFKQAAEVYRALNSSGDYLRCFEKIQVDNEKSAQEHVSYLAQIYLFETAKKCCYLYSAQFGLKSKPLFGQLLQKVMKQQQAYFKGSSNLSNHLLSDLTLPESKVKTILETTRMVMAQLKDS